MHYSYADETVTKFALRTISSTKLVMVIKNYLSQKTKI